MENTDKTNQNSKPNLPESNLPESNIPRPNPKKSRLSRFLNQNWITILAIFYVLSPIDLIPEAFIPVAGIADDAVVVLLELIRKWYLFSKTDKNSD